MQSSCACEPPRGLRRPTSASPLCEAGSRRSLAWSVAKLAGAWVRSLMADLASFARSVAAVVINSCATGRSEWLHRLWPTAAMWRLTCPAGIRAPPRDLFCESLGGVENVGTFDERAALAPKWTAPSCLCNRHVHTHRSLAAGGACGCRFCAVRVAWGGTSGACRLRLEHPFVEVGQMAPVVASPFKRPSCCRWTGVICPGPG